jgi:hypothetical protein
VGVGVVDDVGEALAAGVSVGEGLLLDENVPLYAK